MTTSTEIRMGIVSRLLMLALLGPWMPQTVVDITAYALAAVAVLCIVGAWATAQDKVALRRYAAKLEPSLVGAPIGQRVARDVRNALAWAVPVVLAAVCEHPVIAVLSVLAKLTLSVLHKQAAEQLQRDARDAAVTRLVNDDSTR